jgi:uncharacterized membrane protein YsdA (DUF1294 family)/cold shock CspA family protein
MRLAGRITDWNDDKGFGFVVPNGGGDRGFVHVNAFQRGSRRPVAGDLISYLPVKDHRGRLNANDIRHAGQKVAVPRTPSRLPRAVMGVAALAFASALAVAGIIPILLAGTLVGLSGVAYITYWLDKSAAQRSGRRASENTLHLVALAGGWPGALIAQQYFRHKTIKQPFQTVFWRTVVLNLAVVAWLVKSGIAADFAQSLSS